MQNNYLKDKIQAYLNNPDVLTKKEVNSLLKDCFLYLNQQTQKKEEFQTLYQDLISSSKKQSKEASMLLNDFEKLEGFLNNTSQSIKGLAHALKENK